MVGRSPAEFSSNTAPTHIPYILYLYSISILCTAVVALQELSLTPLAYVILEIFLISHFSFLPPSHCKNVIFTQSKFLNELLFTFTQVDF